MQRTRSFPLGTATLSLFSAGRNPAWVPEHKDIRLIKERFSHEFIQIFGIDPAALTANPFGGTEFGGDTAQALKPKEAG